MTDLSTWPGVSTLWPDGFTPDPWSAEFVAGAVTAFLKSQTLPGLVSVFEAYPITWGDPANFFGSGVPFGVGSFIQTRKERQGQLYTANGKPERTVTHEVRVVGLFKSTLNDATAVTILARRIEDSIKEAIRQNPTLGGRVFEAGIARLDAERDPASKDENSNHCVWFSVDFEVTVLAPPKP